MANGNNPFSMSIKQENPTTPRETPTASPFSMTIKQENTTVPPPPPPRRETLTASHPPKEADLADDKAQSLLNSLRSTSLTPQETETCMRSLTNLMTSSEDEVDALFQEVISKLNGSEFLRMAALLTTKSEDRYFLEIARTKNGSIRLQKLLGRSDDADVFFAVAILRNFFTVMTDEHASHVATQGMRVFDIKKKYAMRDQILNYAVLLGCDQYGSIALSAIIRDVSFIYCSMALYDVVASKARLLSYNRYGSVVVQHVLIYCSLHSTYNIGLSLRGHYVELSSTEGGRCIVEKLLDTRETEVFVVEELLECEIGKLLRLATSEYGHFVVEKALRVTRVDLCRGLANKLKPFLHLLSTFPRSATIAAILGSLLQTS
ncbi:putative pumilio 16 [Hirschfeldia incana]|nr:putative pumilio 16 [Hirschfeldia incana]